MGGADGLPDRGGRYLTWLEFQTVIGVLGDTILAVELVNATLRAYIFRPDSRSIDLAYSVQLPRYYTTPPVMEDVRDLPWIQIGGELTHFVYAPHLATAAFGQDGKLYAVRNLSQQWRVSDTRLFRNRGQWMPIRQALEIYSRDGKLLGSFALPNEDVAWIRPDVNGRLLLRVGNATVLVAADPTATASHCEAGPTMTRLDVRDDPR